MIGRRATTMVAIWLTGAIVLGMWGPAVANSHCSVATLNGLYVFTASGHVIPASGAPQPKAIVEVIRFNGDGTLTVASTTLSLNGVIVTSPPGGTGTYTVVDLVPADRACSGHLTFANGPSFDLAIPPKAELVWMIQTNTGNVFQGSAAKVAR